MPRIDDPDAGRAATRGGCKENYKEIKEKVKNAGNMPAICLPFATLFERIFYGLHS